MKRYIYTMAIAATLFSFASCEKPEGGKDGNAKEVTITTSGYTFAEGEMPRIMEFSDEGGMPLTLTETGTGTYKATYPSSVKSTVFHYAATMPDYLYSGMNDDEGKHWVELDVSATQTYTATGVGRDYAPAYALSSNNENRPSELALKFTQLGCNLRIALSGLANGETVKNVLIEADQNIVAGCHIDVIDGYNPDDVSYVNKMIGTSPEAGAESSSNVWIRTIPTTIKQFKISVTTSNGYHELYYDQETRLANGKTVTVNFDLNNSTKKDTYRIFLIGNSFTQDACHRLPGLLVGLGIKNVEVTQCYYGGRTVPEYDTGWSTSSDYTKHTALPGESVMTNTSGANLATVAASKQWDMVCIQEHTGNYRAWSWTDEEKASIKSLMDKVTATQKTTPKFYWIMSQTYYDMGKIGSASVPYETWSDQAGMYDVTTAFAKKVMEELPFDGIIATGTALQNLRQTELNNVMCLTRDGYHMDYGISRYAAACTCYQVMLYPHFGIDLADMSKNTFRITDSNSTTTPVNENNAPIAVQAAKDAAANPYTVTYQSHSTGKTGEAGSSLGSKDYGTL